MILKLYFLHLHDYFFCVLCSCHIGQMVLCSRVVELYTVNFYCWTICLIASNNYLLTYMYLIRALHLTTTNSYDRSLYFSSCE